MSPKIALVEVTKNTRGLNSREIKYRAIGKYITKIVQRESKPAFKEDGVTPDYDEKGNQKRIPLGKDAEGRLITIPEEVQEFTSEGVVTDIGDALDLVNQEWKPETDAKAEQLLLDCFAEGFNARQYEIEADKDELDEFLNPMGMDEEQKAAFKRSARSVSKTLGTTVLEAAEHIKFMMEQRKAKQAVGAPA